MPILNLPLAPEGAIVEISIGISEPWRQALAGAGKQVPAPILIRALIDPGASCTNVVSSALQPLGLIPKGKAAVTTPSTGTTPITVDVYDVSVTILHPEVAKMIGALDIVECQHLSPDFQALLGRDLLDHCLFVYNGPQKSFSLAF